MEFFHSSSLESNQEYHLSSPHGIELDYKQTLQCALCLLSIGAVIGISFGAAYLSQGHAFSKLTLGLGCVLLVGAVVSGVLLYKADKPCE
ncbi:MAG: hypothetical protein S4CHLAM45_00480 [Chlamydiales bacterium]|nr:hypothetical protein [Chlamydiales bacterium]MCH9619370.1 hypothetical protein [Chlamydiales bacterium]MCH9622174.1 hypothetical protein [Chlamydiales bacterium]